MIRILLIDDTDSKIEQIKLVIVDNCNIPETCIDVAKSINSGRRLLYNNRYDLLLLDLVLPLQDNGEPDREEGPKFIDEIYNNRSINIPNQIIGLTQYDDYFADLKSRFEDKLWYLVKYEQARNDWVTKLQNKIIHLVENKSSLRASIIEENTFNIGIICALQEEFDQLQIVFEKSNLEKNKIDDIPFEFYKGTISTLHGERLKIILGCVGRPGMSSTSIMATTMYNKFQLDSIFMTGFCAGFQSDDIQHGDIVIATSILDYSAGKLQDDESGNLELLKEIQQIPANYELINKIQSFNSIDNLSKINTELKKRNLLRDRGNIKAIEAPTVCGPFVVTSDSLMNSLKKDSRKIKSLDMEGFGLYLTAHILDKKCVWIKSIADFGDSKKDDDYHKLCSHASALFLYNFLKDNY